MGGWISGTVSGWMPNRFLMRTATWEQPFVSELSGFFFFHVWIFFFIQIRKYPWDPRPRSTSLATFEDEHDGSRRLLRRFTYYFMFIIVSQSLRIDWEHPWSRQGAPGGRIAGFRGWAKKKPKIFLLKKGAPIFRQNIDIPS